MYLSFNKDNDETFFFSLYELDQSIYIYGTTENYSTIFQKKNYKNAIKCKLKFT